MSRFIIFKLEIIFIGGRKFEMVKAIFGRGKRGSAVVIAGADKHFHEGVDCERVAQPMEKTGFR